jgi:hypothetical protein
MEGGNEAGVREEINRESLISMAGEVCLNDYPQMCLG